jgi:hypothetical protein
MQIDRDTLELVTAGVKWGAAFDKAFDWADKAGTVGTIGGLAVGSVVPGVGTVAGGTIAGTAGTIGGFAAGLAKGVYDTWRQ